MPGTIGPHPNEVSSQPARSITTSPGAATTLTGVKRRNHLHFHPARVQKGPIFSRNGINLPFRTVTETVPLKCPPLSRIIQVINPPLSFLAECAHDLPSLQEGKSGRSQIL